MSHFCGLVILTPEYAEFNGMDDSLSKYDENLECPEYRRCDVSERDKIQFCEYYGMNNLYDNDAEKKLKWMQAFTAYMRKKKGFITIKAYKEQNEHRTFTYTNYFHHLVGTNEAQYVKFFKENMPELFAKFDSLYAKNGGDWNGKRWRKDANGIWAVYSTYNPESKWDWYCVGGRWDKCIKTKSGELTNECLFGELDLTPFPETAYTMGEDWLGKKVKMLKDDIQYHYTTDDFPFCVVIDGVWYERGEMGWFGCASNEKDKEDWNGEVNELLANIPADSEVYNVDFHI